MKRFSHRFGRLALFVIATPGTLIPAFASQNIDSENQLKEPIKTASIKSDSQTQSSNRRGKMSRKNKSPDIEKSQPSQSATYTKSVFGTGNSSAGDLSLTAIVPAVYLQSSEKDPYYRLQIPITLKLENSNEAGLIVIKKAIRVLEIKVAFSKDGLSSGRSWYYGYGIPSGKEKDLMLLVGAPPPDAGGILYKGDSLELKQDRWIDIYKKKGDSFSDDLCVDDLSESRNLWIQIRVSFFPKNTMLEEAVELQNQWKNYGNLFIGDLTTRPLQIKIPQEVDIPVRQP